LQLGIACRTRRRGGRPGWLTLLPGLRWRRPEAELSCKQLQNNGLCGAAIESGLRRPRLLDSGTDGFGPHAASILISCAAVDTADSQCRRSVRKAPRSVFAATNGVFVLQQAAHVLGGTRPGEMTRIRGFAMSNPATFLSPSSHGRHPWPGRAISSAHSGISSCAQRGSAETRVARPLQFPGRNVHRTPNRRPQSLHRPGHATRYQRTRNHRGRPLRH
jgi:hypothetical protein